MVQQASIPPKKFEMGRVITAKNLNRVVDAANLNRGVPPPMQIKPDPDARASATLAVRQYKVVSVSQDHIVCNGWNGTRQSEVPIKVAKPFLLRQNSFDAGRNGLTFVYTNQAERVATETSSSDQETQVVVPPYVVGDVIYAVNGIVGGTEVTIDQNGKAELVTWLDINADARAWAKKTGT